MVTLEEIRDKKFERAMFGGYAAEEVDIFLEAVASSFSALENENGELRAKMTVLADKIKEYRSIEDGIKDTLLAAQKMGGLLLEKGVLAAGFFYPVVPKGKARIRTQVSAAHTKQDLEFAIDAFIEAKKEMNI